MAEFGDIVLSLLRWASQKIQVYPPRQSQNMRRVLVDIQFYPSL